MLAYHERCPSPVHAKEEAQGAKVTIFDPQLIGLNQVKHLRNHTALLGMAILVEDDIGNQHTMLI